MQFLLIFAALVMASNGADDTHAEDVHPDDHGVHSTSTRTAMSTSPPKGLYASSASGMCVVSAFGAGFIMLAMQ